MLCATTQPLGKSPPTMCRPHGSPLETARAEWFTTIRTEYMTVHTKRPGTVIHHNQQLISLHVGVMSLLQHGTISKCKDPTRWVQTVTTALSSPRCLTGTTRLAHTRRPKRLGEITPQNQLSGHL